MAKKIPEINASSMADISFLLLIFFLVTTSMDVNQGLARRLPAPIPPDQKIEDTDINKRNLFVVKINWENKLLVQGQELDVKQLRAKAKEFIANPNDDANMPKLVEEDFGAPFGMVKYAKEHVISVQNELVAAYNELREECAQNISTAHTRSWMKSGKRKFKRFILKRFLRLNLKIMVSNYG